MVKQELTTKIEVEVSKESELKNVFSPVNNSLVNRWLKFAAVSEKSMQTYANCLKQLFIYFADNQIAAPTRETLENWRDSLIESGKSASTVNLYLTSCKLFFRFLAQEKLYQNITDHLKNRVKISSGHKKDALSVSQAKDLQKSIKGNSLKDLRDKAIIALMLSTGLRSIEICRANFCDIRQIEGNYFLFVQGKGRFDKSESVLIAPKVYKLIQAYIKTRGKVVKNAPLFVSTSRRNKDARLDTQTIRKMIKANLRAIGADSPTLTAHSLRHTAATIMISQGVELWKVQAVLRHSNLNTTMIYNNNINRLKNTAEITAARVLII